MRGNFAPKMIEYLPFLDLQDPRGLEITSQAARQCFTLETRAIQMLQTLCYLLQYSIFFISYLILETILNFKGQIFINAKREIWGNCLERSNHCSSKRILRVFINWWQWWTILKLVGFLSLGMCPSWHRLVPTFCVSFKNCFYLMSLIIWEQLIF